MFENDLCDEATCFLQSTTQPVVPQMACSVSSDDDQINGATASGGVSGGTIALVICPLLLVLVIGVVVWRVTVFG